MIKIKRGDTFAFLADIKNELGEPLVTSVTNIRSQIRDKDYNLITELNVSVTETEGTYLFESLTTSDWPTHIWGENILLMDIELNLEGQITSSETIEIKVIKDVTYDE